MLQWMILIHLTTVASCFRVYNCEGKDLNYTSVSLVDVPECVYKPKEHKIRETYGYIAQRVELMTISAYICRVKLTRHHMNCDIWSSASGNHKSIMTYLRKMTANICSEMVEKRRYNYWWDRYMDNLPLGTVHHATYTLVGSTDDSGGCSGKGYSDEFGYWDNVLINGDYEVTARNVTAVFDLSSGDVRFGNGVTCKYRSGECEDYEGYRYFWGVGHSRTCDTHQFAQIYRGTLTATTVSSGPSLQTTYYIVNTSSNFITLQQKEKLSLCSLEYYSTSASGVVVFETLPHYVLELEPQVGPLDVSVNLQFLTKLGGVDVHLHQAFGTLAATIVYNECLLERSVTLLNMHVGYTDPMEFAYIYHGGPGATAITAGEAIHIAVCEPAFGVIRQMSECYKEIPVNVSGRPMFAHPRTRVLQRTGSPIPCSQMFGTQVKESGKWYGIYPNVHNIEGPSNISLGLKSDWSYTPMSDIIKGGLYTDEEVDKARKLFLYPYEYSAVSSTWSNQVLGSGYSGGSINVGSLIPEETVTSWVYDRVMGIWSFCGKVGHFLNVLMGAYFVFSLVSNLAAAAFNGWHLHRMFGFSWRLLAALCKGVATSMLTLEHTRHIERLREHVARHFPESKCPPPDEYDRQPQEMPETCRIYPIIPVPPIPTAEGSKPY